MAIGLYGGSFNPPHEAHRKVALTALKRLKLDRVWLLVTPGNPLKDNAALPPLDERLAAARRLLAHPRVEATGVEAAMGVTRTYDALAYLTARCPDVRFVWIMGADNLATFHRWGRWWEIAARAPIAVVDRPGATFSPLSAHAAQALSRFRVDEGDAAGLAWMAPPAWTFLHGPRSDLSSTALRGRKAAAQSFPSR
ncbi:nicotinate-nucleotide adenylyltransferase [Hansschlegelia zhihuaiae]|uniref:Probable nicotinate-nucleotide adenylyltransferase n=1 Tax=Hansschlegelia zhihuaiae TaxID=405005 RepID=A0A4V1KJX4_9HYPH|nr:nicotinate-nucleotide adenylyltransferase [Hansschlegelia zhihuaiae]